MIVNGKDYRGEGKNHFGAVNLIFVAKKSTFKLFLVKTITTLNLITFDRKMI